MRLFKPAALLLIGLAVGCLASEVDRDLLLDLEAAGPDGEASGGAVAPSTACVTEADCVVGWSCLEGLCTLPCEGDDCEPSVTPMPMQRCGDGIVDANEGCDDGNTIDDDGCSNACARPGCGDGQQSADEACDDGNEANDDACLTTCIAARCGDGFVQLGVEQCDDGNDNNADDCPNDCLAPSCGDGVVEGREECDGAPQQACTDLGFDSGATACSDTCTIDTSGCGTCGNGTIDGAETCDQRFPPGMNDCYRAVGSISGTVGQLLCTECQIDTSRCSRCGNGLVEHGEACDGPVSSTCAEIDPRYAEGTPSCDDRCQLDTSPCIECGDGVAEGAESCDGDDLAGASCASVTGLGLGELACTELCAFDTSDCAEELMQ